MLESWKEIVIENPAFYIGWGGLLIGFVLGFTVFRTNFCAMGALSDIVNFGDWRRFRSWMLAIAVAMLGVAALQWLEVLDTAASMYLSPMFGWGGALIGGLLFGIGMVFAGGCVSKNLARAGGGDLRSLMVLIVVGLFAYMTIRGLFAATRVATFSSLTADLSEAGFQTQRMGELLAGPLGMEAATGNMIMLGVAVLALLIYCFKDAAFRRSPVHVIAGVLIGLAVVAGWMLTGLAQDDFADEPVALISLSYVRPTGDTLNYLMNYSALGAPGFNVVTLLGALLGGFIAALSQRKFHWVTFSDTKDTHRNLFGAVLMGIGGVLALGCTVGQGVTGISTLALGSLIATLSIMAGGIIGLKWMERLVMND